MTYMLIYQNDDVVDIKRMGIERESLLKGIKFKNKLITVFPEQGCKSTWCPLSNVPDKARFSWRDSLNTGGIVNYSF